VEDLTGTGDHFQARVVSPSFAGRPLRARHDRVHAALEELFREGGLRALALEAGAPEESQAARGAGRASAAEDPPAGRGPG
jgi:stress-induced morphogen